MGAYLSAKDFILGTKGGGPEAPVALAADSSLVPVAPGLVGNFSTIFSVVLSAVVGALVLAGLWKSGGNKSPTSSILISSNNDERPSSKSGFLVVVVFDVVTSGSSTAVGLNPRIDFIMFKIICIIEFTICLASHPKKIRQTFFITALIQTKESKIR